MKEGTEVRVLRNISGHGFNKGKVVTRVQGQYDDHQSLCFYSKTDGAWYMVESEYELVIPDKQESLDRLGKLISDLRKAGFSREVWEGVLAAYDQGLEEIGDN